jgi:dihydrodiol dehydrogenase / D-xylose 1-dehydrogenase (NADP)
MWTRFFPAVEHAKALIDSGALGTVVAVHSDFGFNSTDVADYPQHPFYQLQLGGGGLLYCAPYPVAAAVQVFGEVEPSRIAAAGVKDELVSSSIQLLYMSSNVT